MSTQRQSQSLIKYFFEGRGLLGTPYFVVTPRQVTIQIFYCLSPNVTKYLSDDAIRALGNALTQCWGRPIKLELIRLNHSILDRSILAQYLSMNAGKYSFNRIIDFIKDNWSTFASSEMTGIEVDLAGRLTTQRSGPRQTTQTRRLGSSLTGGRRKVDFGSHTSKNQLGAFTIKVWVSQS